MGKSSVGKGKRFERKCRKVMYDVTRHPHWKRAIAGYEQVHGDLVPHVDEKDMTLKDVPIEGHMCIPYVECKYREVMTRSLVLEWLETVKNNAGEEPWFLLCGQPRGPIIMFTPTERDPASTVLGPAYIFV